MVHYLNSEAVRSTSVSVVLHIGTTNNLVSSGTSTFVALLSSSRKLNSSAHSLLSKSSSSKTVSETRVQIVSSIVSTLRLSYLLTLASSEKIGVIYLDGSTDTVVLLSEFSTSHHTFISVSLVINTANWDVSLMTVTVLSEGRTSGLAEQFSFGTLQVAHVIVSYSVNTTNSTVESSAVVTSLRVSVRALSIM